MISSKPAPAIADVWETLRRIIDPELGCNIVDLGLIYEVVLFGSRVAVEMTLTSPGCPMGDILLSAVRATLLDIPGIERADVHLVWEPPWTPARMSPEAREQLGLPAEAA
jgi:metal-sulfur cluster biosynthetic enzyme